jgi:WD40 repeat protein
MLLKHPNCVNAVALSFDKQLAVTVTSSEGALRMIHLKSGRLLIIIRAHNKSANAVHLLSDVRYTGNSHSKTEPFQQHGTTACDTDAQGNWFVGGLPQTTGVVVTAITASNDFTIKVWNLGMGTLIRTLSGHAEWVNAIAVGNDEDTLISASSDRSLKKWSIKTGMGLSLYGVD